eukprot:767939-Hanusia_phi.AAC.1
MFPTSWIILPLLPPLSQPTPSSPPPPPPLPPPSLRPPPTQQDRGSSISRPVKRISPFHLPLAPPSALVNA